MSKNSTLCKWCLLLKKKQLRYESHMIEYGILSILNFLFSLCFPQFNRTNIFSFPLMYAYIHVRSFYPEAFDTQVVVLLFMFSFFFIISVFLVSKCRWSNWVWWINFENRSKRTRFNRIIILINLICHR